jgi:hypothetical protein
MNQHMHKCVCTGCTVGERALRLDFGRPSRCCEIWVLAKQPRCKSLITTSSELLAIARSSYISCTYTHARTHTHTHTHTRTHTHTHTLARTPAHGHTLTQYQDTQIQDTHRVVRRLLAPLSAWLRAWRRRATSGEGFLGSCLVRQVLEREQIKN